MSLKDYITTDDMTALVASDFNLSGYVGNANDHLEYVAQSLGVNPSGMVYPINYILKEYGVAYAYRSMYLDKIGANNTEVLDGDKYVVLYELQNKEVTRLRSNITHEVVGVSGYQSGNTSAMTSIIYRG